MAERAAQERTGLAVAFGTMLVVVAVDAAFGRELVISGFYSMAAVLAAVLVSVRGTALVGGVAVALAALSALWNHNLGTLDWGVRLILAAALAAMAVGAARIRVQREQALSRMTVIAETAQRAVLRAMPSAVDSVGFAARYVSATQEALIGGDLYEVVATPHGVRVIVGDVRGKGLDAVQMAASVLGEFRQAAYSEPSLTSIAGRLDAVVRSIADEEDFVTALLAEFREDHTVTLVNCGHHPPLLVTVEGGAHLPAPEEASPPLGLRPSPTVTSSAWPEGARMLFYTDGLVEARDSSGAFFSLADHLQTLRDTSLEDALDALVNRLVEHAGRQLNDDMALVLAECRR